MQIKNLFVSLILLLSAFYAPTLIGMNKQASNSYCADYQYDSKSEQLSIAQLAQDLLEIFSGVGEATAPTEVAQVVKQEDQQATWKEFLESVTQNHELLSEEGMMERVLSAPVAQQQEFLLNERNESLIPSVIKDMPQERFHELVTGCMNLQLEPHVFSKLMSEDAQSILDVIADERNLTGLHESAYLDIYLRIPATRALLLPGCAQEIQRAIDLFQAQESDRYSIDPVLLERGPIASCNHLNAEYLKRIRHVQSALLKDFCSRLEDSKFTEAISGNYEAQLIPAVQERIIRAGPEGIKKFVADPRNCAFTSLYLQIPAMRNVLLASCDERTRGELEQAYAEIDLAKLADNEITAEQLPSRAKTVVSVQQSATDPNIQMATYTTTRVGGAASSSKEYDLRHCCHGFVGSTPIRTFVVDEREDGKTILSESFESISQIHENPREGEQFVISADQKAQVRRGISKIQRACVGEVNCHLVIGFEGKHPNFDIACMHSQEFYVPAKRKWIPAYLLKPGDCLVNDKNEPQAISDVTLVNKPVKIYALDIENSNTFYAGWNKVLTHNMAIPEISFNFVYTFGGGAIGQQLGEKFGPWAIPISIGIGAGIGLVIDVCKYYKGETNFKVKVQPERLQLYLSQGKKLGESGCVEKGSKSEINRAQITSAKGSAIAEKAEQNGQNLYNYPDKVITSMPGGPRPPHKSDKHPEHQDFKYEKEEEK